MSKDSYAIAIIYFCFLLTPDTSPPGGQWKEKSENIAQLKAIDHIALIWSTYKFM